MAVVDEASIKITPDTSGFASELRRELEAEIAAATAGLDDVIHIRVETEGDAATDKLRKSMGEFTDAAEDDWDRLKADERDYFDRVGQDAEKARVKQTLENTKLRDRLKAIWQPALDRLKKEQTDEKVRLDKITAAATRAAKATSRIGGGASGQNVAQAEQALAKARQDAEKVVERLRQAEERLSRGRDELSKAQLNLQRTEEALSRVRQLEEIDTNEAAAAERRLGDAWRDGQPEAERLQRLEAEFTRARERANQSAQRTVEVQQQLTDANRRVAAAADAHAAAQRRLTQAQADAAASASRVEEGERRVSRAHDDAARSADRSADSHRRLGDRFLGAGERGGVFGGIMSGLGGIMDGVSGASRIASGVLDNLEGSLGSVTGGAKDFLTSIVQLGVKMSAWILVGEAVSFVVGAIGAAIAGLPALIGAAGASFAVFKLGMDGIKRAYEAELKPALDELGKQISTVFEQGLKPIFHELATRLIPQITDQLKGLAQGWVDVARDVQQVVTSSEGIRNIQGVIDKTTAAVRLLGPAVADLVRSFLNLANTGTILQNMVGIVQDLTTNVAHWFDEMARSGVAERGVQALRTSLDNAEKAVLKVLGSSIKFFTEARPGFDHLVTSVGNVVSSLLDDLGPAFGQVMDAAGRMLDRVPPSVWDGLKGAIKNVSDALSDFADSGAFTTIVQGITDIINTAAGFIRIVGYVAQVTGAISDLRSAADTAANPTMSNLITSIDNAVPPLGELDVAMGRATRTADGRYVPAVDGAAAANQNLGQSAAPIPGQVGPPMDATATAIEDSMRRAQTAAEQGGQGVHDGVTTPLPSMQQQTQVSFDTLPPVVRDAMVGATAAAQTGSDLVKRAVTDGWNGAAEAARTAMTTMQTTVQTGFTTISTSVQGSMTGVSTQIIGTFQNIASVVQTNVAQVVASAQRMAQGVQQAATTMSGAMGQASSQVQGFLSAISSAFQSNMATSLQATQTNMQQIQTAIQNGCRESVTSVQNAMRDILTAIQNGMREAVTAAQNGMRDILQAFTSQEGAMEAAGRALIERLTAGMIAAGAQATAAAASIAASIRAQFPSSPAKEGPLSGQGDPQISGGKIALRLADGMIAQMSAIYAASQQAAAAARSAFERRPYDPRRDAPIGTRYEDGTVEDGRPKLTSAGIAQAIAAHNAARSQPIRTENGNFVNANFYNQISPQYAAVHGVQPGQQVVDLVSALQQVKLQFVPGTQTAMAQFVGQGSTQLARR